MTFRINLLAASALLLASLLPGCGGGAAGPTVYPVKGVVTKGGQPLAGITVTFVNLDKQLTATGLTNEKGEYLLVSDMGKAGMVDGKSKVVLSKSTTNASVGSSATADPGAYYANLIKQREGGVRGAPPVKVEEEPPFSKDYGDANTSPLTFEVKSGSNEFEIPLP